MMVLKALTLLFLYIIGTLGKSNKLLVNDYHPSLPGIDLEKFKFYMGLELAPFSFIMFIFEFQDFRK